MNSKSPEIRFNGFTDDWEQRKLDDLVSRKKSYSLSRSVETSNLTGYKYIHYGDIHTRVADIVNINSKLPNIKSGNYELLNKGDLVLADASEDYQGIAMPSLVAFTPEYKLVAGLHTIVLRPRKDKVDPMFLYYLIKSPVFRKYGYRIGTGMKVFGISITNVLKFESLFPNLKEQQKISSFLNSLDNAIALHQRELEILEKSKEGFLQKMFPKKGEIVPEIRLTNYTNNWKKEKLGNLVQWKRGKGLPKKSLNTIGNGKPVIHYADLYFFPAAISKVKHYSEENEGYLIKQNSLLFPMSDVTPNGLARTSSIQLRGVYAGGDTLIAELNEVNSDFLSYQINANSNKIMKYVTGTTIKHINSKSLSQLTVYITNKQEQEKIGSFLKKIDEKIFYHEEQLIILKQTKKAFLQKMFV